MVGSVCMSVGGGGSCGMWGSGVFVLVRCVCMDQMCMCGSDVFVWVWCVCVTECETVHMKDTVKHLVASRIIQQLDAVAATTCTHQGSPLHFYY